MLNPTKFGSLNLDTPSSRYEFFKNVFKSVKINKKIKESLRLTDWAHDQRGPLVSETKIEDNVWPVIAHRWWGLRRWGSSGAFALPPRVSIDAGEWGEHVIGVGFTGELAVGEFSPVSAVPYFVLLTSGSPLIAGPNCQLDMIWFSRFISHIWMHISKIHK